MSALINIWKYQDSRIISSYFTQVRDVNGIIRSQKRFKVYFRTTSCTRTDCNLSIHLYRFFIRCNKVKRKNGCHVAKFRVCAWGTQYGQHQHSRAYHRLWPLRVFGHIWYGLYTQSRRFAWGLQVRQFIFREIFLRSPIDKIYRSIIEKDFRAIK